MLKLSFLENLNYVYRVELLAIAGIVLLLLYVFWALNIFQKKN